MKFSAQIQHTNDTIYRLSKIQYNNFQLGTKLLWLSISVATLLGAVYNTENQLLFYLLLFAGCWLMSNANMPAKRRAEKIFESAKGDLPCTEFSFHGDHFEAASEDHSASVRYSDLYALLEDTEYFYLFINRSAGYMIPKDSLSPENPEEFRCLLQDRSGLRIRKPNTLLNLNLPRMLGLYRKKKQS